MKRKLIFALVGLVVLVGFYFAIKAVVPARQVTLDVPTNVYVSGYTLHWSAVENASGYEVVVDGETRIAEENKIYLKFADERKQVAIRAKGDGERRLDSEFCKPVKIFFSEDIESTASFVRYHTGISECDYTEFNYSDMPIPLPVVDYPSFGYELLYWYATIGGERIVIDGNFYVEDTVDLYAKIEAIDYSVQYVLDGFPVEQELPQSYNVKNFYKIKGVTAQSEGYRISDWYLDKERTTLLSAKEVCIGNLTLYPRISLINEGIVFEECAGGYAVKDVYGSYETLHIPKTYNNLPVTRVLDGALAVSFDGDDLLNYKSLVFYGDITLEENTIGFCSGLTSCIFYGNAVIPKDTFTFAEEGLDRVLQITIHGTPNVAEGFYNVALGGSTDVSVIISVKEAFTQMLSGINMDIVTVKGF